MRWYDWTAAIILSLCLGACVLSIAPQRADCAGNCRQGTCVNSAQCGLVCNCIVPRPGRLGRCAYVR